MDKTQPITLMSSIKHFFGFTDNKVLMADYKSLTPQDRDELAEGLRKEGYNVTDTYKSPPAAPPAKSDESIHAQQDDGVIVFDQGMKAA